MASEAAPSSTPYADSIRVIDTLHGHSVLLRPVSDEQLDNHLPPTAEALKHLPHAVGTQDGSAVRKQVTGENGQLWGIHPIDKENQPAAEPLGFTAVKPGPEGLLETSTMLFDPVEHGGKGYGTAAKLGIMAVAFEAGTPWFGAGIAADNDASQRSAAKVGFVPLPKSMAQESSMRTGPDGDSAKWATWMAFNPYTEYLGAPAMVAESQQAFHDAAR